MLQLELRLKLKTKLETFAEVVPAAKVWGGMKLNAKAQAKDESLKRKANAKAKS